MKRNSLKSSFFLLAILVFQTSFFRPMPQSNILRGAWRAESGSNREVLLFSDGYFSHTSYDLDAKKFNFTRGGTYEYKNGQLAVKIEFNSQNPEEVGQSLSFKVPVSDKEFTSDINGNSVKWTRIDKGSSALDGNWQITGRKQGDQIVPMNPGPRKTVKLLTGTRFQWIAINTSTKEFFGTGGGTYTFEGGKYTEHIEFFSRDSSRVGAKLQFDGSVDGTKWTHQGLSSRGDPIHEIWERKNPID